MNKRPSSERAMAKIAELNFISEYCKVGSKVLFIWLDKWLFNLNKTLKDEYSTPKPNQTLKI